MVKGYKTLREIKSACKKVDSCSTQSDGFMYKCFPFMMECLIDMSNGMIDLLHEVKKLKKKTQRSPSKYNLFIGEKMREGKTMQEAVELWKTK